GHRGGHGARRAAAEPAREGKTLANGERNRTTFVQPLEQRLRCDAGGVARRVPRQTSLVSADLHNRDGRLLPAGRDERGRHLVAGRLEREPENVEAAGDVRHGRGSKRGYGCHKRHRAFYSLICVSAALWLITLADGWYQVLAERPLEVVH